MSSVLASAEDVEGRIFRESVLLSPISENNCARSGSMPSEGCERDRDFLPLFGLDAADDVAGGSSSDNDGSSDVGDGGGDRDGGGDGSAADRCRVGWRYGFRWTRWCSRSSVSRVLSPRASAFNMSWNCASNVLKIALNSYSRIGHVMKIREFEEYARQAIEHIDPYACLLHHTTARHVYGKNELKKYHIIN